MALNDAEWCDPWHSWFSLIEFDGLYKIQYYGEGDDFDPETKLENLDREGNYPFLALLELISENSSLIHSLEFRGPDEGFNGVRIWGFQRIINTNCTFDNLESFKVELTDPGFHNICIISSQEDMHVEGGTMARLVSKMPSLEELVIPSAPNNEFFDYWHKTNLNTIRIESGFQSEEFIKNYSECIDFPEVQELDFSDVSALKDAAEMKQLATPEEDYEALFSSKAFKSVDRVILRNTQLSTKQFSRLASVFEDLSILVINAPHGDYVRGNR